MELFFVAMLSGVSTMHAQGKATTFPVRDFGAKGDGKTLDTQAVQKALDACGKAGAGTVRFTKGTYLCGALFMKGNTTLHLGEGAILKGSENLKDYPMIDSRWEGTEQKC